MHSVEAFWSRSAQFHKREVLPRRDCYPSGLGMHRSATRLLHRHTICLPCLLSSAPRRCLQHTSKVASASKDLPPPDVPELARLAHLSVTDQQVHSMTWHCFTISDAAQFSTAARVICRSKTGSRNCKAFYNGIPGLLLAHISACMPLCKPFLWFL